MSRVIIDSLALAFASLARHKLRTALSVLGTAIGITAIVVILSAGQSLRQIFLDQLSMFGTDYIQVEIKVPSTAHTSAENAQGIAMGISITTLSLDDKEDIDKIPNVKTSYGAVMGQASASSLYNERRFEYFAVSYEFPTIDRAEIAAGRFFTDEEEQSLSKVVVLGSEAARTLFPNQDPIGQNVKIQRANFKVIGVYEERGSAGFFNMDKMMYVPLRTAQKLLLGFDHLLMIFAQLNDVTHDEETADEIRLILRENHDITDPVKDDFAVTTQKESLAIINTILNGITLVLSIIASVALIVGGVGIMNIMYVAVNERVFEIGLRKAVGATNRRIRSQFLIEAIVVTLLGGAFGVMLALFLLVALFAVGQYAGLGWPFAFSAQSVVLGFVFSSAVGLIFGFFPARRAAELPPVQALTRT